MEQTADKKFYYHNLFYDYLFHFDRLKPFYSFDHRNIKDYRQRAEGLAHDYKHGLRDKLADLLAAHNRRLGCSQKTAENIEKLRDRSSVVVVGGHQPILFGGPLFVIHKAVTVTGMAHYLENTLQTGVVPCFWNASDDSNTQHIDNMGLLGPESMEEIRAEHLENDVRFSQLSLSHDQMKEILDRLEKKLAPTDFRQKIMDFLGQCTADASQDGQVIWSDLFSCLLLRFFAKQGLVIMDPAIAEIKQMGWEVIESNIRGYRSMHQMAERAGRKLEQSGYHSQIKTSGRKLDFFVSYGGKRHPVLDTEGGFTLHGQTMSAADLADYVKENIGRVCPNVLLRPLLQDTVFPVLATVCGPGEVSYFAQLKDVYGHMGQKLPIIYPRFCATLVEKKVKKILKKYELDYPVIEKSIPALEKIVLKKFLDFDIEHILSRLDRDIMKKIRAAEQEMQSSIMDKTSAFDRIKRNMQKETGVLKGKLFSEYKKQNSHLSEGIGKLKMNLLPQDDVQERKISIFSFINKYDFAVLDIIHASFKPFSYSHTFLEVDL